MQHQCRFLYTVLILVWCTRFWESKATCVYISPIFALRNSKMIHLFRREHGEILERLEVGWEKVACRSTKVAISLKRIKIEEKLLWRAYRKLPVLFRFFGLLPYSYSWFCLYGHWDGRFCLIFARTAQQSVLEGTNGLSSFKPCVYCRIVHRIDIFAMAQLSCT